MKIAKRHGVNITIFAAALIAVCAGVGTVRTGLAQTSGQPPMAEDVFKNVQVLRGIAVDDFMGTMGIMATALSMCCEECHSGAGTDKVQWEADTPRKRTARRMVLMVNSINRNNFGGRQVVTCWTCHRGRDIPTVTPDVEQDVYGSPRLDTDDVFKEAFPGEPSPDQLIDKYIQAVGGAKRLDTLTSFTATGTSTGFGGLGGAGEVHIFAKAPAQRATIVRFPSDPSRPDEIRTYDGSAGWMAIPHAAVRAYPLGGSELDGARLDAQLSFPGQIRQALTNLHVGPPTSIEGRAVHVVQGMGSRGLIAKLYLDSETGLLARVVRYGASPIGRVPTQIDYADYRDVNGIKMPFRWTFAWLTGRTVFQLKQVRPNAVIDPAVFQKPATR
jgi:hypothetical protein